ncbi:MAG: leucine-rich repeat domain-containing protein [Candidatus Cloacimonetes bacterium]|nr:leucine-rich repeat domain-containing protein [Candidatus Cloacimonadota bacterium]
MKSRKENLLLKLINCKKRRKALWVILPFAVVIFLHANLSGQEIKTSGDFEYTFINNDLTITDYLGEVKELIIPDSIDGFPVTAIGDTAFTDNNLYSVTIPSSVKTIGEEAFYNNSLSSVFIPNSVTVISDGAFDYNCLDSVNIPQSVKVIGKEAFCDNLLESVIIPDSVIEIGENAFSWNDIDYLILPLPKKDGYRFLYWQDSDGAEYPADTEIYHLGMGYKAIFEPLERE